MKVAVIGSGISGLSVSHFLSKKHKVDLFEKDNHFGGHSLTLDVKESNAKDLVSLDLGFIPTTDGVVLFPSAFSITRGSPPSIIDMQEFVVPKSIPRIFGITHPPVFLNHLLDFLFQ